MIVVEGMYLRSELSEKKGTDYSLWEVSGQSEETLDQRGEAGAQDPTASIISPSLCLFPGVMWVLLCMYPHRTRRIGLLRHGPLA